jgi:hypothetical protein
MKQGGLLFPKESTRKKRKKHHKSIIASFAAKQAIQNAITSMAAQTANTQNNMA